MAGYGPGCHPQNIILNKTNFKVLCTFTQGRISYKDVYHTSLIYHKYMHPSKRPITASVI
jgi:hypothetical protein